MKTLPRIVLAVSLVAQACIAQPTTTVFERLTSEFVQAEPNTYRLRAIADFDGDGSIDVVVGISDLVLLLNDGEGALTTAAGRLPSLSHLLAADALDVDGDGDADLLCYDIFQGGLILENDGNARFTTRAGQFPQLNRPIRRIHNTDLDGDGDVDVLTMVDVTLRAFENDGSGRFTELFQLQPINSLVEPAFSDLDGDGLVDLVLGSDGIAFVTMRNRGDGRFVPWNNGMPTLGITSSMTTGDFDGDGDQDLAVWSTGPIETWNNNGSGQFTRGAQLSGSPFTLQLAAGDTDQDGDDDVVATIPDIGNVVHVSDGRGGFSPITMFDARTRVSKAPRLADMDRDGDLDLLQEASTPNRALDYWCQDRRRAFVLLDTPELTPQERMHVSDVGDVDGDGYSDLVLTSAGYDPVSIASRIPGRGFARATGLGPTRSVQHAQLSDIEGDGDLDLLVAGSVGSQLHQPSVLINDGVGGFTWDPNRVPTLTAVTQQVVAFDYDQDGDEDWLAVGDPMVLFRNDGGTFSDQSQLLPNVNGHYRAVAGDVNGDGRPDIVGVRTGMTARLSLWINAGPTGFADRSNTFVGPTPVAATDAALIDVRGVPDLIVTGSLGGVWQNDGTGVFTHRAPALTLPGPTAVDVAVTDRDADGVDELYLLTPGNQGFDHFEMRFDGSRFATSAQGSASVGLFELHDVDADGDMDFANSNDVLVGRQRQTHFTRIPRIGMRTEFEISAIDGIAVAPVVSTRLAATPIPTPIGRIEIDTTLSFSAPPQPVGTSGRVRYAFRLPNTPSLQGQTLVIQSIVASPGSFRLTAATARDVIR